MDGGGSPRCLRLGVRDGGGSSDTCVDWVVGTDSISSCTLMVGMDGRSASVVLVVVSDVSNSECRAPRLFGSRIEGLPAILLLCLTPSVVRKLMLEGKLTVCLYSNNW